MRHDRLGPFLFAIVLLLGAPLADAQVGKLHRVAFLEAATPEGQEFGAAFRAGMRELGYVEGRNVVYESRPSDKDMLRASELVDELIAAKPDVMVASEHVAQIMRTRTSSIPIVLATSIDPVKTGLAKSLRKPGMNVTGNAQLNNLLPAKHVGLAREILPRLKRIGQFVDTSVSGCKVVEAATSQAARSVGVVVVPYYVENREDIERAFSQMEKMRPDVLMPCPSLVLFNHRDLLFESAKRLRIPFTSFGVTNVPSGVLFAYAASIPDLYRKAATYVDKILKGANPGDLPIEQPTKFELVVNLKSAGALGIKIPQSVLLRADRVIE